MERCFRHSEVVSGPCTGSGVVAALGERCGRRDGCRRYRLFVADGADSVDGVDSVDSVDVFIDGGLG